MPSLTLLVERLKYYRVPVALIGCNTDSLPPLGSYFDFMDRLWAAPETDLYAQNKLLPASRNSKRPVKPKEKKQKAHETMPKLTEAIEKQLPVGKDIPSSSIMSLSCLPWNAASYQRNTLQSPAMAPPCIPMSAPRTSIILSWQPWSASVSIWMHAINSTHCWKPTLSRLFAIEFPRPLYNNTHFETILNYN